MGLVSLVLAIAFAEHCVALVSDTGDVAITAVLINLGSIKALLRRY